jgi:hypothetical protein
MKLTSALFLASLFISLSDATSLLPAVAARTPLVSGLSYSEVYQMWKGKIHVNYFVSGDAFIGYETNLF